VKLTAKEFGRRLRKARLERMLTQAELAEAVGCGQSLISYYELGEVRSVPFETIERLAAVLGVIRERVEQIYRALYDKIEAIWRME
jgi:transcriptional regulator with XRE-family HTH domain